MVESVLLHIILYLYLRYPEQSTVKERIGEKASDIQSKKIKVEACHTPPPEIEENLHVHVHVHGKFTVHVIYTCTHTYTNNAIIRKIHCIYKTTLLNAGTHVGV